MKIFISLIYMVAIEILNLQDANNIGKKKQVVLMKEHRCTLKKEEYCKIGRWT